jgi:transcriptional regulator of acetoin/glycerol metabolism
MLIPSCEQFLLGGVFDVEDETYCKKVFRIWEQFVRKDCSLESIREEVADSWVQSKKLGINAFEKSLPIDKKHKQDNEKTKYLINVASPYLEFVEN